MVDLRTIRFTLADRRLLYLTGGAVANYVVAFDAGDRIEPMTFTLRDPRVMRRRKLTSPMAKRGSAEHRKRSGLRHPPETFTLVGADGSEAHEPVLSSKRMSRLTGRGKARMYGDRLLRINKDRFAAEGAPK
jgi:hypothetical protein